MTALPASFYLGPQMAEFGISLAGAALAGEGRELDDATRKLRESINGVRSSFSLLKGSVTRERLAAAFERASDSDARELLESMRSGEHLIEQAILGMQRYLSPDRQALLATSSDPEALPDLQAFHRDLRHDHLSFHRMLYAALITMILQRAAIWISPGIEVDEGLEDRLETADPEQLEQWHETALLLINEDQSRRLVSAAGSPPEDHHDDFLRYAGEGSSAA